MRISIYCICILLIFFACSVENNSGNTKSGYFYNAETGAYVEASRKEIFSLCTGKEIEGTWISEHSLSLDEDNCLSVQTPNLAGTFYILFRQNSNQTDTIQILVDQSYIQMGDYSHRILVNDSEYDKCFNDFCKCIGDVCFILSSSEIERNGHYESRNYNQPLIVDKTMFTMGDALHYNKIDTTININWILERDEYKNKELEESDLPFVTSFGGFGSAQWRLANERSKKEGLDTAYIRINLHNSEAEKFVPLGNPSIIALDTSASGYRVPFEDEWMFLMHAGASTRYYWGDSENLSAVSNYEWINPVELKSIARKFPNEFGLYDMMGIAYEEVVSDFYKDFYDLLGTCSYVSPECIFMKKIAAQKYYQSFRLLRKTPKMHKLEKF